MNKEEENLWAGISPEARGLLKTRSYTEQSLEKQLSESGLEAGRLISEKDRSQLREVWIPGVEIFSRKVFRQAQRGLFAELSRQNDGLLAQIGFWPQQWSAARMFAGTAKGFHVHPPSIPKGTTAAAWHRKQFAVSTTNVSARQYDQEQWDVMFVLQGAVEFILRDVRDGLPARTMRFLVEGDERRGANNVGVVIPPGVAHAVRAEGSVDVIMVYGTDTTFRPEFEGRIGSEVEEAALPESWQRLLR